MSAITLYPLVPWCRLNGGELFEYVVEKDYLDEKEATIYTTQLLSAINYFHQKKIVHLDLKVCPLTSSGCHVTCM